MKKVIELKTFGVGKYDDNTPYIVAEELSIAFSNLQSGEEYFVTADCNGKKLTQKISGEISLPVEFLSCGELNLTVKQVKGKKTIKEWQVEPLRLQNTSMGISSLPEIAVLQEKITQIGTAAARDIYALNQRCNSLEKALETQSNTFYDELKEKELELVEMQKRYTGEKKAVLKYLYRHYWKDITDSDGDFSVQEFAAAIGLDISDLSEKDLQEIDEFKTKEGAL